MNNNLRTTSDNFQNTLHPQHHNIYPDSHSSSANKTNNGFYSKETFIVGSSRNRNQTTFKHEAPHMPSPTEKNNSFSDIISPHNVQTVINMSLEKELENNNQKSLNTMSNRSNIFDESSIKEENKRPENPSGFEMKEHDSLLEGDFAGEIQIQPNKRVCMLCHNSKAAQDLIVAGKTTQNPEDIWEYDLIYPCLCNIKAHRECLKSYMLVKKVVQCERCKTTYAVEGKKTKDDKAENKTLGAQILAYLIYIVTFVCIMWRKYFSNSLADIAVHCKQTEIARHQDNPEQTFRRFTDQEEKKKNSAVINKARRILALLDPIEFEAFIKMTTPRLEKAAADKVANHERHASSHFLLSDPSHHKDKDESELKNIKKEIFIAPTEIEKSEATMPDYQSNINEYSKTRQYALPQVRVNDSNPSKHIELPLRPFRPQMRVQGTVGSQSERNVDHGMKPQPNRLLRLPLRDSNNASIGSGARYGYTARDYVPSPDLLNQDISK